jgi:alanyl-tRNA synthetase
VDVVRVGEEQALLLEPLEGELHEGERVIARVDAAHRRPTEANHTATHLLHAALRQRLGPHVRQAGSYVGPDKLRFDFTHGQPLSDEEYRDVEDLVNEWIVTGHPVRALTTTLDEARSLGAMALFGEKYGDVVRMVEIGDARPAPAGTDAFSSRELCGGTHVRSTAEIGVFKITQETSSAANVRRIEAVTGPEGVALLRGHDRVLGEAAEALRSRPVEVAERAAELQRQLREARKSGAQQSQLEIADLAGQAVEIAGVRVLAHQVDIADPKAMMEAVDHLKGKLGDSVVVLGGAAEGRVHLVVGVTPSVVERGVRAGAIVKTAAQAVGGGGGGRDTMAQAGGRDPDKLPDALAAARAEVEKILTG